MVSKTDAPPPDALTQNLRTLALRDPVLKQSPVGSGLAGCMLERTGSTVVVQVERAIIAQMLRTQYQRHLLRLLQQVDPTIRTCRVHTMT